MKSWEDLDIEYDVNGFLTIPTGEHPYYELPLDERRSMWVRAMIHIKKDMFCELQHLLNISQLREILYLYPITKLYYKD